MEIVDALLNHGFDLGIVAGFGVVTSWHEDVAFNGFDAEGRGRGDISLLGRRLASDDGLDVTFLSTGIDTWISGAPDEYEMGRLFIRKETTKSEISNTNTICAIIFFPVVFERIFHNVVSHRCQIETNHDGWERS